MGGIDYLRLDKTKDKAYAFDHVRDRHHAAGRSRGHRRSRRDPRRAALLNKCASSPTARPVRQTYTMMGGGDKLGVVPLTADDIFARISEDVRGARRHRHHAVL